MLTIIKPPPPLLFSSTSCRPWNRALSARDASVSAIPLPSSVNLRAANSVSPLFLCFRKFPLSFLSTLLTITKNPPSFTIETTVAPDPSVVDTTSYYLTPLQCHCLGVGEFNCIIQFIHPPPSNIQFIHPPPSNNWFNLTVDAGSNDECAGEFCLLFISSVIYFLRTLTSKRFVLSQATAMRTVEVSVLFLYP